MTCGTWSSGTRSFGAAVTGLGLVTSAGIGVEENWNFLQSGRSRAAIDDAPDQTPVQLPGAGL